MYPESSHLFACPTLITGYWRKAAGKVGDVTVTVSAGCNVWKAAMLEPLTLVFVAPLLSHIIGHGELDGYQEWWTGKVKCTRCFNPI